MPAATPVIVSAPAEVTEAVQTPSSSEVAVRAPWKLLIVIDAVPVPEIDAVLALAAIGVAGTPAQR